MVIRNTFLIGAMAGLVAAPLAYAGQTASVPAAASTSAVVGKSFSTLVAPTVPVPATHRYGTHWEAHASALVQKAKKKYVKQLHEVTAASALEKEDALKQHAISKDEYILGHATSIVGKAFGAQSSKAVTSYTKQNQKSLAGISSKAPTQLQNQIQKAAVALGMKTPSIALIKDEEKKAAKAKKSYVKYRVFVSQSMGEAALQATMRMADKYQRMQLVFKGIKKGQTVYQLSRYLESLHKTKPTVRSKIPHIIIDPIFFTQQDIQVAPVLEKLGPGGKVIAKVAGIDNPAWINTQVAKGHKGNLGKMGPTHPVIELNLLKAFQKAAKHFNEKKWAEKSVANFWKKYHLINLPDATRKTVYHVNPTVVVTRNITLPDGKVIAKKGETYNLLKTIGFHQKLLIFNETKPDQVSFAKKFLAKNPDTSVILITTQVNRKKSWLGYRDVENHLRHAVYVLNRKIVSTWKLKAVPSIVTAKGPVFVITEVPVHQGDKDVAHHTEKG